MASIKGSSSSNPFTFDEPEAQAVPKPKPSSGSQVREFWSLVHDEDRPRNLSCGYVDLTEDDARELRVEEIPAASLNAQKRKSNRPSTDVPGSSSSSRRRPSPAISTFARTPSAKPPDLHRSRTPTGNDTEARHGSTPRRGALRRSSSHSHSATPSRNSASRDRTAMPSASTADTASHTRRMERAPRDHPTTTITPAPETQNVTADVMPGGPARQSSVIINSEVWRHSIGEGSTGSALGSRAESEREQTITRRVDSDATRPSMHGHNDSGSRSASKKSRPLKQGSHSRVSSIQLPRAVKSANKRRVVGRAPQLNAKNHEGPSHSMPPSRSRSASERSLLAPRPLGQHGVSSPDTRQSEEDSTAIQDAPEGRRNAPQTTSKPSPLADAGSLDMGAHSSRLPPSTIPPVDPSSEAPSVGSGDAVVSDSLGDHVMPVTDRSLEHLNNTDTHGHVNGLEADAFIDAARCRVEACLQRHLEDRFEDHAYLVKNTMWRQRTCYEREVRPRADATNLQSTLSPQHKFEQSQSPFAHMRDIQSMSGNEAPKSKELSQEILPKATSKGSTWSVPIATHAPEHLHIPSFKEYVRLKNSILADNESKILTLPYLGDDEPEERQNVLRKELPTRYEILHDNNVFLDLRREQCQFYYNTTEAFLKDIGVSWETMMYWLLSPATELRQLNKESENFSDFEGVVKNKAPYDTESFNRAGRRHGEVLFKPGSRHWRTLLTQLQKPSVERLRLVALAGAALIQHCNFSPWYMIKECETMRNYVHTKLEQAKEAPEPTFRNMLCRVCHEHDCVFHGEIREDPQSNSGPEIRRSPSPSATSQDDSEEDDSDVEIAHYDPKDSDVERIINYKFLVNSGRPDDGAWSNADMPKHPLPPSGPFKATWWENKNGTSNWENRKPFVPCNHLGSCTDAKCRCFRENITCEKTCSCPKSCNRRFPGCTCAQLSHKPPCATKTGCICRRWERECDADLCGTCGANEILDPVQRHDEQDVRKQCQNAAIQRGVPKKTLLGRSEVHGFGLYAGEDICKGEHIGEYIGEIISNDESQRREIIYHYEKNMYLFTLNQEQDVDATYMGNKLRFINNADVKFSNCFCRVALCNTVFRIALVASSDIKAGTELFFNYNYPDDMTKNFMQPKGKVVAVRQLAKDASKAGTNRASSHASSNNDDRRPVAKPKILAATAKARAAKEAKRQAMLAAQGLGAVPPKNTSRASRPARKSAGSSGLLPIARDSSARGRTRTASGATSRDASAASGSVAADVRAGSNKRPKSATPVVEETDDEDAGFNAISGAEESSHDSQAEARVQNATSQSSSRLRNTATRSASVMAVKEVKKKKSRLRSVVGRKRKRPIVVHSDDEE